MIPLHFATACTQVLIEKKKFVSLNINTDVSDPDQAFSTYPFFQHINPLGVWLLNLWI